MSRPSLIRSTTVGWPAGPVDVRPQGVVSRDQVPGALEQALALGRQADPAGRPQEEPHAQSGLQPLDLAAQRLLGDVQPGRSAREVELLGRRHEVAQRTDVELVADGTTRGIHAIRMIIGGRQVLDARTPARDGGGLNQPPPERSSEMLDPGALGTLIIRNNAERASAERLTAGVADAAAADERTGDTHGRRPPLAAPRDPARWTRAIGGSAAGCAGRAIVWTHLVPTDDGQPNGQLRPSSPRSSGRLPLKVGTGAGSWVIGPTRAAASRRNACAGDDAGALMTMGMPSLTALR